MKPLATLASELKQNTTACRVSFTWLGTRKALETHQRAKAAEPFGAEKAYISASQKILDTKNPAFAALTSVKNEITAYWKNETLPYTEDGVRLLQKTKLDSFCQRMTELKGALGVAKNNLDLCLDDIKDDAKKRLGTLYNEAHYPKSMADVFEVQWDFPNTEPPEYLAKLAPTVYQAEQQKAQARMQEAIALAEQAFLIELDALIKSLHERLTPGPDGAKKVFRDSTIKNLGDFFTKFKTLNIGSNEQLDNLVDQANDLIKGINPADLRDSALLRTEINKGLAEISGKLDPLVTNLPRRKIIMPKQE